MGYQSLSFLSIVWIVYGSRDVPFIRSRVLCGYDAWQWALEGLLYFWGLAWCSLTVAVENKIKASRPTHLPFLQSLMLLMQQRRWQDTPNPNTSNSRSNLSSNLSSSRPQIPTSAPDAPLQKSMSNPRHRSLPPPKSRIRIFRRTGIGSRDTNDAIRGLLSYTWKMDGIGIGRTESIDGKGEGGGE